MHREASQTAGFNAHLLKPIDRRELLDTLLRFQPGAEALPEPSPAQVMPEDRPPVSEAPGRVHNGSFDRAGALQRLGGNQTLLERLLGRFVNDHANAAQQIIAAIEAGETERAAREAHTLKGVAANLGASQLAATAGLVEAALRQGEVVQGVQHRLLAREELVAVLPLAHRLAGRAQLALADLAGEVLVDFPEGTGARRQTDEAFQAVGLQRRVQFEIGHVRLVEKFVQRGMAVGLVPERVAQGIEGVAVARLVDAPVRHLYAVWSSSPTPAARAFLDVMEQCLGSQKG